MALVKIIIWAKAINSVKILIPPFKRSWQFYFLNVLVGNKQEWDLY